MYSSLIKVIALVNEMQVFMYDNSNFICNPHLFTIMYIQKSWLRSLAPLEVYTYIYILSRDYLVILLVVPL